MSSISKKKKIGLIIVATFLLLAIIAMSVIFAINASYVYEPIHANLLLKEGEMATININYNGAEGKPCQETITAEAFSYVSLPKVEKEGYIFIDKKLRFMGCNDRAYEFFPELKEWELEKKLPGKGGRFNTYLRQPLYKYIEQEEDDL